MAFVAQRNKTDCGVACLAMLCDVSYEDAYNAIEWKPSAVIWGTNSKQLREAAARLGWEGRAAIDGRLLVLGNYSWDGVPDNSLVKVPNPADPAHWHWVAWRNNKVYDPAWGVFKPGKYNRRPTSYMEFVRYA